MVCLVSAVGFPSSASGATGKGSVGIKGKTEEQIGRQLGQKNQLQLQCLIIALIFTN